MPHNTNEINKMPKYNLALIPVSKGDEAVEYAKQLSELADKYILGKDSLPHMTLLNTRNKDYEKDVDSIKKSYNPISDKFVLSLGHSDDVGQLTKILFTLEVKPRLDANLLIFKIY